MPDVDSFGAATPGVAQLSKTCSRRRKLRAHGGRTRGSIHIAVCNRGCRGQFVEYVAGEERVRALE